MLRPILCALSLAAGLTALPLLAEEKSQDLVIIESLQGLAKAFNKHDAGEVAAYWAKNGVHTDSDSGATTEGREAIAKMYADTFAAHEGAKLAISVGKVRFITPEVAAVDGLADVTNSAGENSTSSFTAVVVKHDGKWLLDSARETAAPVAPFPGDYLAPLEWLVGDWVDAGAGAQVKSTVRWSAKKAFLIRSYSITREDQVAHEGTQIFGWDPRHEVIRTWVFGSDGGFAEGRVQVDGDRLAIKLVGTTAAGQESSGTQIIVRLNDDAFVTQIVGREIDGEAQPTLDPVEVIRAGTEQAAKETEKPANNEQEKKQDKSPKKKRYFREEAGPQDQADEAKSEGSKNRPDDYNPADTGSDQQNRSEESKNRPDERNPADTGNQQQPKSVGSKYRPDEGNSVNTGDQQPQ